MARDFWRKWISYLIPQTKYVKSDVSGYLQVGWIEGEKVVDSRRANYSFGPLQRELEYGLNQIDFEGMYTCLVLGMGAGSVVESLRDKFKFKGLITAVDLDPVMIQIADEVFDIRPDEELEIICDDAIEFVSYTEDQYDLIVIDVFVDITVPKELYRRDFWENILEISNPNTKILFNAGVDQLEDYFIEDFKAILPQAFELNIHNKGKSDNTLMILSIKDLGS